MWATQEKHLQRGDSSEDGLISFVSYDSPTFTGSYTLTARPVDPYLKNLANPKETSVVLQVTTFPPEAIGGGHATERLRLRKYGPCLGENRQQKVKTLIRGHGSKSEGQPLALRLNYRLNMPAGQIRIGTVVRFVKNSAIRG